MSVLSRTFWHVSVGLTVFVHNWKCSLFSATPEDKNTINNTLRASFPEFNCTFKDNSAACCSVMYNCAAVKTAHQKTTTRHLYESWLWENSLHFHFFFHLLIWKTVIFSTVASKKGFESQLEPFSVLLAFVPNLVFLKYFSSENIVCRRTAGNQLQPLRTGQGRGWKWINKTYVDYNN